MKWGEQTTLIGYNMYINLNSECTTIL